MDTMYDAICKYVKPTLAENAIVDCYKLYHREMSLFRYVRIKSYPQWQLRILEES